MISAPPGAAGLARLLSFLLCVGALLGCSHHSNSPPGTPVLTISSTQHSYSAYIVAIDSITLTRSDGATWSPLINPQTIDLVRTAEVSELVEAPAVPSGTYVSASLTLDYTAASVWTNVNGQPTALAPRDQNGNTLTTAIVTVTFDPAHQLTVTAGSAVRMQLQLDLEAFNTINLAPATPVVYVRPFAVLTPLVVDRTPTRVRGLFVTTQSAAYVVNIRPFHDLVSALGAITVNIGAETYFNVNGATYTGAAGLTALAALPENTPIAAYGAVSGLGGITPSFTATAVYGGTSLENTSQDHLIGTVSARSGNTLTLLGAELVAGLGGTSFFKTATVTIGSATIVSEDGNAASTATPATVSVGQRINVSGVSTLNATSGTLTLDATGGQVRLLPTRAWGTLVSATPVTATVDLLALGDYRPSTLNFAGTASGGGAVNPAAYLVSTGSADQSATAPNTLLAADGFVGPFGAAPPDFLATSVTPASATRQQLVVEWPWPGSATPFTSVSANGIILQLSDPHLSTAVHNIFTGPASIDLVHDLPASPLITTNGADPNSLVLAVGSNTYSGGVNVFNTSAGFETALNTALSGGAHKIYRLVALGSYRSVTNTFVADTIDVALQP